MIITRLIGGLGNQMFQYAAARALALRCQVPLKLDITGFAMYADRRYELGALAISAQPASHEELRCFGIKDGVAGKAGRWWRSLVRRGTGPVYREAHFHFDPRWTRLEAPVYLEGYWQSEKYFREIADLLRREYTTLEAMNAENARLAEVIDSSEAVSVHVRRGDYVTNPRFNSYHGTCSLEYYAGAMAHIAERVSGARFFIFSDDQDWTRGNLRGNFPMVFVEANPPERGHADMQLMRRCRYHIVANSSFSWWGAWLADSPRKIVVAPERWFRTTEVDDRDLIPETWVRL